MRSTKTRHHPEESDWIADTVSPRPVCHQDNFSLQRRGKLEARRVPTTTTDPKSPHCHRPQRSSDYCRHEWSPLREIVTVPTLLRTPRMPTVGDPNGLHAAAAPKGLHAAEDPTITIMTQMTIEETPTALTGHAQFEEFPHTWLHCQGRSPHCLPSTPPHDISSDSSTPP